MYTSTPATAMSGTFREISHIILYLFSNVATDGGASY